MKDFSIELKGCLKADRKEAIRLIKIAGRIWNDKDRFKDGEWTHLNVTSTSLSYDTDTDNLTILTMPQDMPKLKEALGIEVPKDGEVWIFTNTDVNEDFTARVKNISGDKDDNVYSCILINGKFSDDNKHSGLEDCPARKANESEDNEYIKTEHSNGYHWNGKHLNEEVKKKPTKRIILSQYESIEILVDEFEMVHKEGKVILYPEKKPNKIGTLTYDIKVDVTGVDKTITKLKLIIENNDLKKELKRAEDHILENSHEVVDLQRENEKLSNILQAIRSAAFKTSSM